MEDLHVQERIGLLIIRTAIHGLMLTGTLESADLFPGAFPIPSLSHLIPIYTHSLLFLLVTFHNPSLEPK